MVCMSRFAWTEAACSRAGGGGCGSCQLEENRRQGAGFPESGEVLGKYYLRSLKDYKSAAELRVRP